MAGVVGARWVRLGNGLVPVWRWAERLVVQQKGLPQELLQQQVLLEELDQELAAASAAWVVQALDLLQAAQPWPNPELSSLAEGLYQRALALLSTVEDSSTSLSAEPMAPTESLPLELQAERAMAAGDWRQAGLLWRQLLRPPAASP